MKKKQTIHLCEFDLEGGLILYSFFLNDRRPLSCEFSQNYARRVVKNPIINTLKLVATSVCGYFFIAKRFLIIYDKSINISAFYLPETAYIAGYIILTDVTHYQKVKTYFERS